MSGPLGVVITIVLFLVVLGGLVLVHELGHFITARLAGVRVLEFGIGFPPRAKVLRSSGETLYTLNWLPIGGFVKLEGEDGDDTSDPRSFARARLPVKVIVLVAGVAMNLLLSLVIFTSIAWLAAPVVGVTIPVVEPGSPAEAAGLKANDAIISVNGIRHDIFSLSGGDVIQDLRDRVGETVTLQVVHPGGQHVDIEATLRTAAEMRDPDGDGPLKAKGALGISTADPKVGWPPYFPGECRVQDENGVHDSGGLGTKHRGYGDAYLAHLGISFDDWDTLGPQGAVKGFSQTQRVFQRSTAQRRQPDHHPVRGCGGHRTNRLTRRKGGDPRECPLAIDGMELER